MRTKRGRPVLGCGLAATLCVGLPSDLRAEALDKDEKIRRLETMMLTMQREIRSLKSAVGATRAESRRTHEKIKIVERRPAVALPASSPTLPPGAVPAFVTADKKLQFGAITITPGGFIEANGVFRSRTQQADVSSNFQAIPFGPLAGTNEYRLTARHTRVALLAEAAITPALIAAAYGELDFLGAGTANSNEANSYNIRIRNLYATLDSTDLGLHVLAGQNWSLTALNSKGITPRNEVAPPTIEAQYVPGFAWKRQAQIRLTKDFDRRLWVSVAAEAAQHTVGGTVPCTPGGNTTILPGTTDVAGITCGQTGTGNLFGGNTFSLNNAPDVTGKLAYEARLAERDIHLEAFGLYRNLNDRVAYTNGRSGQQNATGYGVGGGLIVPVIPRRLDFLASGMVGRGIGTYGTSQFADTTFGPTGALSPIPEDMALAGFVVHATPAIDLYAFGGIERVHASYFANGATISDVGTENGNGTGFTGYGVPNVNNNGCKNLSTLGATTCAGNSKQIYQGTAGFWNKIYKGGYGEIRVGAQYSYTVRELFASTYNGETRSPRQDTHMAFTSLRYYPFQ